jgi:large subunit ribosomal protein LP0
MSRGGGKNAERKVNYWKKLISLFDEYPKILLVTADNVGSHQMQQIRQSLRGEAVLLMGKNTMIRKAIRDHRDKIPSLETLSPHIYGNVGLVFTKGDLTKVRTKLTELKVEAQAKTGATAPVDVIVPAGNTGQEPNKTSFFQALSIPTKINRGSIEIINDVHLMRAGDRVSASQAALLQMLGIRPFKYGLVVTTVYDSGIVFKASVLDITDEDIIKKFQKGVANVTALSLAINYPTVLSVPHVVLNAFKNLLAVSLVTDYTFEQSKKIKEMLENPEAFAAAASSSAPAPSAATTTTSKTETADAGGDEGKKGKDKSDSEDEDIGMGGGLFGGDEDDY